MSGKRTTDERVSNERGDISTGEPNRRDESGQSTTEGILGDESGLLGTDSLSPEARLLALYLRKRVEDEGECYLKSRFIAREIDLSSKQIGSYMHQLKNSESNLSIEKWSYTNGTTWRVTG